jgi:hypothetical protein
VKGDKHGAVGSLDARQIRDEEFRRCIVAEVRANVARRCPGSRVRLRFEVGLLPGEVRVRAWAREGGGS